MDLVAPDDFCDVSADNDRSGLIKPYAEQLGMGGHDPAQVAEPIALRKVLVDGGAGQEGETPLITHGHHFFVTQRAAANEVLSLNCGARRTAADDAAATEHFVKRFDGLRSLVGVDEAPLPPAAKPDPAS